MGLRPLQLALTPLPLALRPPGWMDTRMYGRTLRISPHSTGLCPLSGLRSCYPLRLQNIKEAGQGNQLLRDALWQLVAL